MPNISSPLGTSNASMPLVNPSQRNRLAGTLIVFNTIADMNAAIALERTNIANGVPMWQTGQPLAVASEQAQGLYRVFDAAAQHGRNVVLRPGLTYQLAGDGNTVSFASGAPAAGDGIDGDVSVDWAANAMRVKTAGAWTPSAVTPAPTGGGTTGPIVSADPGNALQVGSDLGAILPLGIDGGAAAATFA